MGLRILPCGSVLWDPVLSVLRAGVLVCGVAGQPRCGITGLGAWRPSAGWLGQLLSVESTAGVCVCVWNVWRLAGLEIQPGLLLSLLGTRAWCWPRPSGPSLRPGKGAGAAACLPTAWHPRPQSAPLPVDSEPSRVGLRPLGPHQVV